MPITSNILEYIHEKKKKAKKNSTIQENEASKIIDTYTNV